MIAHVLLGNRAAFPFDAVSQVAAAAAAQTLNFSAKPASGLLMLNEAPWLCLRAFLRDAADGSAADRSAVIDLIYWYHGTMKGVLVARLTIKAGTGSTSQHPLSNTAGVWYECDQAVYASGLLRPEIRSSPDGSCLIYFPMLEAVQAQVRVDSISAGSTTVLVVGKPVSECPAPVIVPFHAKLEAAAGTFTNEIVELSNPIDGSGDLAAPGSGQEYVIESAEFTSSVDTDWIITTAAGDVWGAHTIPAGYAVRNWPLRVDGTGGLRVGENAQPKITAAATGGGNFTGRIDLFGRRAPLL